jgi:hypothetical protein
MKTNPLHIEPGTFFICGGPNLTTGTQNHHFEEVEKMLKEKGYPVFNPEAHEECKDFKTRCSFLAMCDKVVTLPDWDRFENSVKEVQIARSMGKYLIFSETLLRTLNKEAA